MGAAEPAAAATAPAFSPLAYQRAWLADRSRYKIGLWARQTGKSTACALEVNDDILTTEAAGARTNWVLLSRGERQSKELARKVREFGELIMRARHVLQGPELVELEGSASEIRYPGGSRAIALPANPDTARGYSAHVILDEFAFHADSDAIWTALFPTITRGHKIRVISTPNGQQNRFYQLWTEAQQHAASWSAHRVTIGDAVDAGLAVDAQELHRGIRDELAWRQEYLCEFVDEATAWLPWELIRAAEDPRASIEAQPVSPVEGPIYAGWDVARWHDLSVLWLVERVGDVLWTQGVVVMQRQPFEAQLSRICTLLREHPRFVRMCVDATGIGEMPAEQARIKLGGRVEGLKLTAPIKELLAADLRRVLEDRRLRLPLDDQVRADLHSVRRTMTAAGHARFEGEIGGSHADRFWAAALAVHAAGRPGSAGLCFL
jgi:phage FluMu gp28-like protein